MGRPHFGRSTFWEVHILGGPQVRKSMIWEVHNLASLQANEALGGLHFGRSIFLGGPHFGRSIFLGGPHFGRATFWEVHILGGPQIPIRKSMIWEVHNPMRHRRSTAWVCDFGVEFQRLGGPHLGQFSTSTGDNLGVHSLGGRHFGRSTFWEVHNFLGGPQFGKLKIHQGAGRSTAWASDFGVDFQRLGGPYMG